MPEPELPETSEPALEELELRHPPLPAISLHTGGGPAMDMTTGGGVGEEKKRVCGKCANCLGCTRRTKVGQ